MHDASSTWAAPCVPVAAGLFEGTGARTRLLGTRCTGCATVYFPRAQACRNPACPRGPLDDVALPREGRLYSYTVQAYRPPPLFRMDGWAPYALGLVDLPGGLRVMGMLTGCSSEDIRIGMPVAVTTGVLYRDAQGREVLTYQFCPAGTGADE